MLLLVSTMITQRQGLGNRTFIIQQMAGDCSKRKIHLINFSKSPLIYDWQNKLHICQAYTLIILKNVCIHEILTNLGNEHINHPLISFYPSSRPPLYPQAITALVSDTYILICISLEYDANGINIMYSFLDLSLSMIILRFISVFMWISSSFLLLISHCVDIPWFGYTFWVVSFLVIINKATVNIHICICIYLAIYLFALDIALYGNTLLFLFINTYEGVQYVGNTVDVF